MPGWVDSCERYPHVCALTRNGEQQVGPFYDTGIDYMRPRQDGQELRVDPKVCRLYLSAQGIRELSALPASPQVVITRDDHMEAEANLERLQDELADTAAQLQETQGALSVARSLPPLDVQTLANSLVVSLEDRLPKRPGPKPKQAA